MEFFDDPSEIDYHIIETKYYIDSADWEEVEAQVNVFIRVLKNKLLKINNGVFHSLAQCDGVGDLLDIKRHMNVFGAEEFRKCLLAVYSIKETLSWDKSFDDKEQMKQDFHKEVDRLQQCLKEAMLIIIAADKWGIETKYEKSRGGLKKGRKQPKGMVSLYACIRDILREKGFDAKHSDIFKKLKTYTDDSPYKFENYELKYDKKAEKLYQVNNKTFKERSCGMKKVYEYRKKIRKK